MKETAYRDLIRALPCSFCGRTGEQLISWHHLRHLKQAGTGMKPPAWATIPVCDRCHRQCHTLIINRNWQTKAMLETWETIGIDMLGVEVFWRQMGRSFASIIELEK